MKLCMYVGYHDASNVSNFGGDPVTQLHFKNVLWCYLRCFTDMALHSRDAVTVSAAVATRSRADCSSMEGHTSLSTALVHRRYAVWSREVNLRSRKILDINTNFISCERMQHEIYHGRQIAIDVEHKHCMITWILCYRPIATTHCL